MLSANRRKGNRPQATISEKEKTMTYTKPEVAVVGEAVRVIEQMVKSVHGVPDGGRPPLNKLSPAYDLDE
jgi:hypothetical protein